jgi:hypothetical protein
MASPLISRLPPTKPEIVHGLLRDAAASLDSVLQNTNFHPDHFMKADNT